MTASEVKQALAQIATPQRAQANAWFFKSGPGQYGEGDQFVGVSVPAQRQVARRFKDLPLVEIKHLLDSPVHEHRLTAVLILDLQFKAARKHASIQDVIYRFYIDNLDRVNNWDIVDSSAPQILGSYLIKRDRSILFELAKSDNLWRRRVAIVSTLVFTRTGDFEWTFKITQLLLGDKHDLIHKACGWMLREVGKVDTRAMLGFLDQHYKTMPRTMLRYAIEHLEPETRLKYLSRRTK